MSSTSEASVRSSRSAISLQDKSEEVPREDAKNGRPKVAFHSRPYRPLSAEDKTPVATHLPGSPDPFSKKESLLARNHSIAPRHAFQDSSLTMSHDAFSVATTWSAQPLSYRSEITGNKVQISEYAYESNVAKVPAGKFRWAEKISRLTDSCVGRIPKSPVSLVSHKSFTPLSDSVSACDWPDVFAGQGDQGKTSSVQPGSLSSSAYLTEQAKFSSTNQAVKVCVTISLSCCLKHEYNLPKAVLL